jgi:1,4-alpha-glucan branching enzyme
MAIKKTELKSGKIKVTFKIASESAEKFASASLVGDFNNWNKKTDKMKKLKKDGSFTIQKTFESGKEYQFKYLLGTKTWLNEVECDKYADTEFDDSQNSVIVL